MSLRWQQLQQHSIVKCRHAKASGGGDRIGGAEEERRRCGLRRRLQLHQPLLCQGRVLVDQIDAIAEATGWDEIALCIAHAPEPIARYWIARPNDLETYAAMLKQGNATCPLEAIWPASIEVGQPAMPAHPLLTPELWANIAAAEGNPVVLPVEHEHLGAADDLMQPFWRGLAGLPLVGEANG